MIQAAIKLKAALRSAENGKAKKIRKSGFIPAVIYGAGLKSRSVKVKGIDFERAFNIAGESHLIDLTLDDKLAIKVIVKDIQKDFLGEDIIHIDFYKVDMKEKITAEIPLNFIGESRAVKELGGTLVKNIDTIEVKCLPGDLTDKIDVDLSGLDNFHDVIRMKDLKLPPAMELTALHNEIVVSVVEPVKEEVVVEAAPAEAVAAEAEAAGEEKVGEGETEKKKE